MLRMQSGGRVFTKAEWACLAELLELYLVKFYLERLLMKTIRTSASRSSIGCGLMRW